MDYTAKDISELRFAFNNAIDGDSIEVGIDYYVTLLVQAAYRYEKKIIIIRKQDEED